MVTDVSSSSNLWLLGVALCLTGSTINAIGWMLQKRLHIQEQIQTNTFPVDLPISADGEEATTEMNCNTSSLYYIKRWQWWFGFLLYGVGSLMASFALTFAPLSLLAPLESWTIVCNALLAHRFLNEKLFMKDWMGICIILFALIITVFVGPKSSDQAFENGIDDVADSFKNTLFLCVAAGYSVMVIINYIFMQCKCLKNECFLLLSLLNISAYFGAWNLLTVKCILESIENSVHNLNTSLFYGLIVMWASTMMILEYWRQKALKVFISTYVMAIYRVFLTAGSLILGAVYSGDFVDMDFIHGAVFVIAILIAFIGVILVAFKLDENGNLESRRTILTDEMRNTYVQTDMSDPDIAMGLADTDVEMKISDVREVLQIEHHSH